MKLRVEQGKKTLKIILNEYEPVVRFDFPYGDPKPSYEIFGNRIIASLGDMKTEFHFEQHGHKIIIQKKLGLREHCLGMGEKALPVDKRRSKVVFYNYDNYGYQFYSDPLYASIPFLIFVNKGIAYGLFINSTSFISADIGIAEYDKVIIEIHDDAAELYLIFGPKIEEILEIYTNITGKPFLPPKWALGYMISRYSYYPQDYVLEIVENTLNEVPLSAVFLDIDYMNNYKIFTWDAERFPNPKQLIEKLREKGVNVVTIINPFVKVDEGYEIYREAKELCIEVDGKPYVTVGWPGECILPDFFRKETREWWAKRIEEFVKEYGISGIWLDMNEPTVFNSPTAISELVKATMSEEERIKVFVKYIELIALANNYLTSPALMKTKRIEDFFDRTPDPNVLHKLDDGRILEHKYVRNAYPYFQAMTTYEGLKRLHERPFILSRSGYAGIQKYAAIWTGDAPTTWYALRFSISVLLNLSISGVVWCGTDLGGYVGRAEPELDARWYQAFALAPLFRLHQEKGSTDEELFNLPSKYKEMIKRAISLRYHFMPYLWHLAWEAHLKGRPLMRPLCYEFQEDEDSYHINDEYMVGPYVLFAPIVEKNAEQREVYLPPSKWVDYWNGKVYEGRIWFKCNDEMPLFLRYGSAIPVENGLLIFGEGEWEIYHGEEGKKAFISFKEGRLEQRGEALEVNEVIFFSIKAREALVDGNKAEMFIDEKGTHIKTKGKFSSIDIIF